MLLDPKAGVLVQGITGREASRMVEDSLAYGSNIVAGVTPEGEGSVFMGYPSTTQLQRRLRSIVRLSALFLSLRPPCSMPRWSPSLPVCCSVSL